METGGNAQNGAGAANLKIRFTKMHGCGNDYIFIDGFTEAVEDADKPALAVRLSDRHCGIGGDGLVFINPSPGADFAMEMFNADGSRAEMCGNAIRCIGKYVYEHGMTARTEITVESGGKIKYLHMTAVGGRVTSVRVNMGSPEFTAAINEMITVAGTEYKMTDVSMGNPHAVVPLASVTDLPLAELGPPFEHHKRFPNRTNVEFIRVIDRKTIQMRVWERGSGETMACGTGACAAAAACIINGLTENAVTVKLWGGELLIEWDRDKNAIYMTGPAVTVFTGEFRAI